MTPEQLITDGVEKNGILARLVPAEPSGQDVIDMVEEEVHVHSAVGVPARELALGLTRELGWADILVDPRDSGKFVVVASRSADRVRAARRIIEAFHNKDVWGYMITKGQWDLLVDGTLDYRRLAYGKPDQEHPIIVDVKDAFQNAVDAQGKG